jgi:hypothetical protein
MIARNGVQPTSQLAWGDWCNVIGTGFGVRPTTNTGNTLEDAFVWIKPGGECDVSLQLSLLLIYTDKMLRELQTPPQHDMITTVVLLMLFNLLPRLEHGSRLTLSSS